MTFVQFPPPPESTQSLSAAIAKVFKEHKEPALGGPSRRGWSSIKNLQTCPRMYFLDHVEKNTEYGGGNLALDVGTLFHVAMALDALWVQKPRKKLNGTVFLTRMRELCGDVEAVAITARMHNAYEARYENDFLRPIAVELEADAKDLDYSCRYDLLAKVSRGASLPEGTYIIEHKTSGRIDEAAAENWLHDGQIIGQQLLYRHLGLEKRYGELQGTIVNMVSRNSPTRFHRLLVVASDERIADQLVEVSHWRDMRKLHEVLGAWPKTRSACVNRYGRRCDHFQECNEF